MFSSLWFPFYLRSFCFWDLPDTDNFPDFNQLVRSEHYRFLLVDNSSYTPFFVTSSLYEVLAWSGFLQSIYNNPATVYSNLRRGFILWCIVNGLVSVSSCMNFSVLFHPSLCTVYVLHLTAHHHTSIIHRPSFYPWIHCVYPSFLPSESKSNPSSIHNITFILGSFVSLDGRSEWDNSVEGNDNHKVHVVTDYNTIDTSINREHWEDGIQLSMGGCWVIHPFICASNDVWSLFPFWMCLV